MAVRVAFFDSASLGLYLWTHFLFPHGYYDLHQSKHDEPMLCVLYRYILRITTSIPYATLFDLNPYALYRLLLRCRRRHKALEPEFEPFCLIFVELLSAHPE